MERVGRAGQKDGLAMTQIQTGSYLLSVKLTYKSQGEGQFVDNFSPRHTFRGTSLEK